MFVHEATKESSSLQHPFLQNSRIPFVSFEETKNMSLVPGAPFPTGIGGGEIRRTHQNYHTAVCEQVIAWTVTYLSYFTSFHFIPSLFSVESVCCLKNLRQSLVCSKSVQVLSEELDCRAENRSRYLEISQSQIKCGSRPFCTQSAS